MEAILYVSEIQRDIDRKLQFIYYTCTLRPYWGNAIGTTSRHLVRENYMISSVCLKIEIHEIHKIYEIHMPKYRNPQSPRNPLKSDVG